MRIKEKRKTWEKDKLEGRRGSEKGKEFLERERGYTKNIMGRGKLWSAVNIV